MPEYLYKAKNITGKAVRGKMDAESKAAVVKILKGKDLYPVEVRETNILNKDIDLTQFSRITLKDLSIFCRQFSTVFSAGITVLNSLDIMRKQIDNLKLKKIINNLFEEVQKGHSLSSAMRKHKEFPNLFINMIAAGEASGQLDLILQRMAVYYEKEYKLQKRIKSAMTYPISVAIVAVVVVIFMITSIVPLFTEMLESAGAELPLPTRMLLGMSSWFTKYWFLIAALIILIIYLFRIYIKHENGRYLWHKFLLDIPGFGKINRKIITSRFSSTLSILLSSGIPIIQAMDIVEKTITNAVVERGIERCKDEIKMGAGLSGPVASMGIFPPMLTEMIGIGEESGQIDDMLSKTAEFYDSEVDTAVGNLTTLIEPVIIILIGGMVAFIVISIVMPMFEIYNHIA